MAFKYNCKECPMKFQSESDLQTHLIVHSNPYTDYGLESTAEPLLSGFLQSFFPNLDPSEIPSLNPSALPSLPDDETADPPSEEANKSYATLANMHVPGLVVPNLDDLIKIQPEPKKTIRYLNPIRFARDVAMPVIQTVYIERPQRSIALIQNTYGDDRCSRTRPDILRPEVLSRVSPTITTVRRFDPKEGEKLGTRIPACPPKEPPPKDTIQCPIATAIQNTPKTPEENPNRFTCKICNKAFPSFRALIVHHRNHVFGKLYTCFQCHRRFAFSYQLNNHLLMHTREEHPQDPVKRFGKRGRTVYSCNVCKRSFGRINYLNLHKRRHERKEQVVVPTESSPQRNLEYIGDVMTTMRQVLHG